jgi:hypothetical protein
MAASGDNERETVLLDVSKIKSNHVARQSAVGTTPLLPATYQQRVLKFHNGMSILTAISGVSVQLCSSHHITVQCSKAI